VSGGRTWRAHFEFTRINIADYSRQKDRGVARGARV